jgi:hypothetical protein
VKKNEEGKETKKRHDFAKKTETDKEYETTRRRRTDSSFSYQPWGHRGRQEHHIGGNGFVELAVAREEPEGI